MRAVVRFVAGVALALSVAGCNAIEAQYIRQGIGTNIAWADAAAATEAQNIYLEYLCRQAAPYVGPQAPGCTQDAVTASTWPLIVQAGMNDIDLRCDDYLAWLDQKKREAPAILAEIGAVRGAVDALTNPLVATSIGGGGLAAVAAAFALATNTFNNVNSLLLQVDHTTVQSVVFGRRQDFRVRLKNQTISDKPSAVHALRMYLTICMPMTIAADINQTITTFQQAGAGAIDRGRISADPGTIVSPTPPPRRADRPIEPTPPPRNPAPNALTEIERTMGLEQAKAIQRVLCVDDSGDLGPEGSLTRKALIDFKAAQALPNMTVGRIENQSQLAALTTAVSTVRSCMAQGLNPFEVGIFSRFGALKVRERITDAINNINMRASTTKKLPVPMELTSPASNATMGSTIRAAVTALRDFYSSSALPIAAGTGIDSPVWRQITRDAL
jgi:hypothetical protein